MRQDEIFHKIIMYIFTIIISFFIFTSLWGFYISVRPPKIHSPITPQDLGLDYEDISFVTGDNLTLRGWFLPNKTSFAKTIILLHGYPADKGDILPALSFLNKRYNLLLFDFRYLGQSEGKYSTAGAKEVEDLRAAIKFLKARGIQEVGVWGFSMGGAVALMAPKNTPEIKAIVSEASYASLDRMAPNLFRLPALRYPLGYLTGLWAKLFLGVNIKNVSPVESAKNLSANGGIPILIIHSKNDEVIPFVHALLLRDALKNNPRAEFWFEENLAHGQLGGKYQKRIEEFFEKNL